MKRIVSMALVLSSVMSLLVSASAFDVTMIDVESSSFNCTVDCGHDENQVPLAIQGPDEKTEAGNEVPRIELSLLRSTSKPTKFYNIGTQGIYNGSFTGVNGTIYTNYYFDTNGNDYYYVRINVLSQYPANTTFVLQNYCKDCNKWIGETDDITTNNSGTGYLYYKLPVTGSHSGHNAYPAIQCTGTYSVSGTIDVNYKNTWS